MIGGETRGIDGYRRDAKLQVRCHTDLVTPGSETGPIGLETRKSRKARVRIVETYRWLPGEITVVEGDQVTLEILGVNGASHPGTIEGYDIDFEVKRGQLTTLEFTADKPGVFRIVCHAHLLAHELKGDATPYSVTGDLIEQLLPGWTPGSPPSG